MWSGTGVHVQVARTLSGLCQDSARTLSGLCQDCQDCQDRCGRSTNQVSGRVNPRGEKRLVKSEGRPSLVQGARRASPSTPLFTAGARAGEGYEQRYYCTL